MLADKLIDNLRAHIQQDKMTKDTSVFPIKQQTGKPVG
jgi:hypothetical protein